MNIMHNVNGFIALDNHGIDASRAKFTTEIVVDMIDNAMQITIHIGKHFTV